MKNVNFWINEWELICIYSINFVAVSYVSYLEGEFNQVFLHFTPRLWSILGSDSTKFPCISQPDSGLSLAQIQPSFLAFYSQTLEYPWLKFNQVSLHFTARLWIILGSNSTKFPCILQPDSGVSLAQIQPSFLAFHSQSLEYPWLKFNQVFLRFTARLWCFFCSTVHPINRHSSWQLGQF